MKRGAYGARVLYHGAHLGAGLLLPQRPAKVHIVVQFILFIVLGWFETDKAPGTLS